jgi:hypothetical protein
MLEIVASLVWVLAIADLRCLAALSSFFIESANFTSILVRVLYAITFVPSTSFVRELAILRICF